MKRTDTIQEQLFTVIISSDLTEFREITKYLRSQDCFVVEVHCDNSTHWSDIKKLAFHSHLLVKISHSLIVEISLKNKGKKHCTLFVSDSTDKTRAMAEQEIKVNEEDYYALVILQTGWNSALKKICLSSAGTTSLISKHSNCSQSKPNTIIKIPVIFIPYQPYICR